MIDIFGILDLGGKQVTSIYIIAHYVNISLPPDGFNLTIQPFPHTPERICCIPRTAAPFALVGLDSFGEISRCVRVDSLQHRQLVRNELTNTREEKVNSECVYTNAAAAQYVLHYCEQHSSYRSLPAVVARQLER